MAITIIDDSNIELDVIEVVSDPVVVEIMSGPKGDQNVYVGPTPPDNPQEGWIWIETS